jgi:dynein heavy chain
MWAYGASLDEDKNQFSNSWKAISRIKFPETGMCFDYFYEPLESCWKHWDTVVAPFNKEYEGLY